jgi:hypothetical protein
MSLTDTEELDEYILQADLAAWDTESYGMHL